MNNNETLDNEIDEMYIEWLENELYRTQCMLVEAEETIASFWKGGRN